jgi:hypothetical protein
LAVGATDADVLRLLLGDAGRAIAAGLAIGAVTAYKLGSVLSTQLYAVKSNGPVTYVVERALLGGVAFAAPALPGMRAKRIPPAMVHDG